MGNIGLVETPYGSVSLSNTKWRETWSFWSRKCIFTQARIAPFTKIMRGRRIVNSGGRIIYEYYWTAAKELTMQKLKGTA